MNWKTALIITCAAGLAIAHAYAQENQRIRKENRRLKKEVMRYRKSQQEKQKKQEQGAAWLVSQREKRDATLPVATRAMQHAYRARTRPELPVIE